MSLPVCLRALQPPRNPSYVYGIALRGGANCKDNALIANSFWDAGGGTVADVRTDANVTQNTIFAVGNPSVLTPLEEGTPNSNTLICSDPMRNTLSGSWRRFVTLMSGPDVVIGSAWTAAAKTTTDFFGGESYNNGSLVNDGGKWYVELSQGTYTVNLYHATGPNLAILTVDVSMDGGTTWTSVGTSDGYAAGAGAKMAQFTGVVLPVPAVKPAQFRLRALTKNASSGAYGIGVSAADFVRTA